MNNKVIAVIAVTVFAFLSLILGAGNLIVEMVSAWRNDKGNATPQKPPTEIVAGNELPRLLETRYGK